MTLGVISIDLPLMMLDACGWGAMGDLMENYFSLSLLMMMA